MEEFLKMISPVIPPQYQKYLLLIPVIPYITRAYYSLKTGGGLIGVWRSIMFGTNGDTAKTTTTQTTKIEVIEPKPNAGN